MSQYGMIHGQAQREIWSMVEEYGATEAFDADRIWRKVDLILSASSTEEAQRLAKSAYDSAQVHILFLWSAKKIQGPPTRANLERQAGEAESLAEMLDKKENKEAAEKQRQKALELRRRAAEAKR